MRRERGRERRVFEFGPPRGCSERRQASERRKLDTLQVSLNQFEVLMASLGFRADRPDDIA